MFAIAAAILIASLLGSFHCAGMCGAFVAIASGGPRTNALGQARLQAAYHVGRLLTYMALGAAAGGAGRLINLAGALAGLRPAAALFAGAVMVLFGAVTLLRSSGYHVSRMHLPPGWLALMARGHRLAMRYSGTTRALFIGLLTTLLPCGWLYAFVAAAAGTGRPSAGVALMAVFWLGTLPILVTLGAGVRATLGPLGARLPVLTAWLLVAAGLYTLAGRTLIDPVALAARVQARSETVAKASPTVAVPNPSTRPACCDIHDPRH